MPNDFVKRQSESYVTDIGQASQLPHAFSPTWAPTQQTGIAFPFLPRLFKGCIICVVYLTVPLDKVDVWKVWRTSRILEYYEEGILFPSWQPICYPSRDHATNALRYIFGWRVLVENSFPLLLSTFLTILQLKVRTRYLWWGHEDIQSSRFVYFRSGKASLSTNVAVAR